VVVLLIVALAVVLGVIGLSSTGGVLDPRSAAPDGSLALATLLRERGVEVTVSRTGAAEPGQTTVVAFPSMLSGSQLARLAGQAGGGTVVLIAPSGAGLASVDAGLSVGPSVANAARTPSCALPEAQAAGIADTGGATFAGGGTLTCYPAVPGGPGTVAVTRVGGARVVLFGEVTPFLNDSLAAQGNAGLVVGLLSDHPHLRWLLPGPPAPGARRRALISLLPRRLVVAAVEVCLAVVLLALARARRLGPPVEEPLPVQVRATETVLGRARLYQAARAREAAAESLRAATRRRLSVRLGLGRAAVVPAALLSTVAERSGRTSADLSPLLYGAGPAGSPLDDHGLLRLAHDLTAIEEQVRAT
jgi:hypothetical protein